MTADENTSLLAELGLTIDRDYRVATQVWDAAVAVALATGERSSRAR